MEKEQTTSESAAIYVSLPRTQRKKWYRSEYGLTLEERQVIDHSARVIASTLGIVFLVGLTVVIKDSAQEVVEMGGRIREALPSFGDVFLSAQCGIGEQVANPYCKGE